MDASNAGKKQAKEKANSTHKLIGGDVPQNKVTSGMSKMHHPRLYESPVIMHKNDTSSHQAAQLANTSQPLHGLKSFTSFDHPKSKHPHSNKQDKQFPLLSKKDKQTPLLSKQDKYLHRLSKQNKQIQDSHAPIFEGHALELHTPSPPPSSPGLGGWPSDNLPQSPTMPNKANEIAAPSPPLPKTPSMPKHATEIAAPLSPLTPMSRLGLAANFQKS